MNNMKRIFGVMLIFVFLLVGQKHFACEEEAYDEDFFERDKRYCFSIKPTYCLHGIGESWSYDFEVGEEVELDRILTFETIDHDYVFNQTNKEWEEVGEELDLVYNKLLLTSSDENVIEVVIEENYLDGITDMYLKCKSKGDVIITADYYYNNKHYVVETEYSVGSDKVENIDEIENKYEEKYEEVFEPDIIIEENKNQENIDEESIKNLIEKLEVLINLLLEMI